MTSWKPHGLIQLPGLEEPYQDAKRSVNQCGDSTDPKEYYTVHLFEDLFNKAIFTGDTFFVNSQQPPSRKKGSDKACDIVVKYLDGNYHHEILCFAECKRARNVSKSKIRDLEIQAQDYCRDFLDAHHDINLVHACTLVGSCVRCWSFSKGESSLKGFWDGDEKDHFEFYKDVGLDENKVLLDWAFNTMKSVPTASTRLGSDYSSIGSRLGASSFRKSDFSQSDHSSRGASYDMTKIVYSPVPTTLRLPSDQTVPRYPNTADPLLGHGSGSGSGSGSGNTVTYPIRDTSLRPGFDPQAEAEAEEHYPAVPDDAIQVELKLEDRESGDLFHFDHEGTHYAKEYNDWEERTVIVQGKSYECVLSTEKTTGEHFWAYSLRDLEPLETGKGKGRPIRVASTYGGSALGSISGENVVIADKNKEIEPSSGSIGAKKSLGVKEVKGVGAESQNIRSKYVWVIVEIVRHTFSKDEYVFRTTSGKSVSTDRDEWKKGKIEGKTVDIYERKGTTYVSRDRL